MILFGMMPAQTNKSKQSDRLKLDENLIIQTGNDDMAAFQVLYHQTDQAVYGFILSIVKNQYDAEDIMQDTYIKIRECAHLYKPMGKPLAWIFTIARNLSLMRLRDTTKNASFSLDEAQVPMDFSSVSDCEERLVLESAFQVLNDTERQIIMLHAVSGLKHREISDLLEIPLATVLSKYARALTKLKKQLISQEKEQYHDESSKH